MPTPDTKRCPHCAEEILLDARKCKHCGEWLDARPGRAGPEQPQAWNRGVAAVLSFVIPGLGQIYKGDLATGLVLLLFTVLGYTAVLPGLLLHLYAVYSAYSAPAPRRQEEAGRADG